MKSGQLGEAGCRGGRVASRAHFPRPSPCQEGLTCTSKAQKRARGAHSPTHVEPSQFQTSTPGEGELGPGDSPKVSVRPKKAEIRLETQEEEARRARTQRGLRSECWCLLPLSAHVGSGTVSRHLATTTNDLHWAATPGPRNLPRLGQRISPNKPPLLTALSVKSFPFFQTFVRPIPFTYTSISPPSP